MPIDIHRERLIRLIDVGNVLPSIGEGKRPSRSVLFRWASRGYRGVILETIRIRGGRFTSREALARFIVAQRQSLLPPRSANSNHKNQRRKRSPSGV